jgi:hypothetical protein
MGFVRSSPRGVEGAVLGTMAGLMMATAWKALTLSPASMLGLFYVQRYRFLTIAQFARAAGLSADHAGELLRQFENRGVVGISAMSAFRATARLPRRIT